jgi:hypothetical protein
MAITITQQPPVLTPAYGDIVISASSNLVVSKFKFKYVYDIISYNPGTNVTSYVGRVRQTPNPSGVGMLDLSRYLQNQVDLDILGGQPFNTTGTPQTNNNAQYTVYVGEEYSDTLNGIVTLYNGNGTVSTGTTLSSVATSTGNVFNGAKQFSEGFVWNAAPYTGTTGRTLLTDSPRNLYKQTDEYITAAALYSSGFPISGGTYAQVYNAAGTLLTVYAPNSTNYTSSYIRTLYGGVRISTIVSGYENTWYRIVFRLGLTNQTEALNIYNKGCAVNKYNPKDVIFMNRLGGWDTFRFFGSKDEQVKIARGTYQRAYGTWSSSTFNYNTWERGTSNIKTDLIVEGEVMSDFLERDTVNWLEELLTSPQVYFIENNVLVPINITNTSFKNQLKGNVRLRQVSFTYEKSNQTRTQQQ